MLCEIGEQHGFLALWAAMSALGALSVLVLSSVVFIPFYGRPSFEKWQYKTNPKFPSPQLVRKEVWQSLKGVAVGVLCPVFAVYASSPARSLPFLDRSIPLSMGYCGDPHDISWSGHLLQAAVIIGFSDFVEYAYHWVGHYFHFMWNVHKHHHVFYNPTPFAVIADEWMDQFIRSMPMVILPMMMPINIDLLFGIFGTLFYGYGVYLHWGYESPMLSAHNPIFNTSYHHYSHHATSIIGRPVYTGFFFKIWDYLFNTNATTPCNCVKCRPKRTLKDYANVTKPDYSILLQPSFWLNYVTSPNVDVKE
jgi:lathosterol oxidase